MNKKLFSGILVIVFLVSAFSASGATWSGIGKDIFEKATSGFKDTSEKSSGTLTWYDQNTQLIDFIVFFIIFLSISYMGLKKWIEKGGNAGKSLAIGIGIALSLAALKAGISATFFIPFVENAFFFILFIVIFFIYQKMFEGLKK